MMNKISGILMLLVYVCVATALLNEAFLSPFNMQNIVRWSSLFGIIGIGVAFVIITGGIDLSIGSVIGFTGVILPMLLVDRGWSVPASLAAVMAVAVAIGLLHGLLITRMNLQPFIVTLCGLLFYRGLARWITGDQTQGFGAAYDDTLRLIAIGRPCSVAFVLLVAGVILLLAGVLRLILAAGQEERERRVDAAFWMGLGLVIGLIGSSRYWFGYSLVYGQTWFQWGDWELRIISATVPPRGAEMPGQLLRACGWLFIPASLWFAGSAFRRDDRRQVWRPLVAALASAGLLAGGMALTNLSEDRFWPSAAWADRWKMLAIFVSLGLFMGALSWFGRTGARVGGLAARLPLQIAFSAAVLYLMGQTSLGKTLVPAPFLILAVLATVAAIFLNQTIYGRYLLALGRNEEAARFSGIKTQRMIVLAYVISASVAGLGGILFTLDGNAVQPAGHGSTYELYAIAAAVLGGCSLRGGEGSIIGVVIGAAVMRVLNNSITLLGISPQLEYSIIGLVILAGALVDEIVRRITARRRMKAMKEG